MKSHQFLDFKKYLIQNHKNHETIYKIYVILSHIEIASYVLYWHKMNRYYNARIYFLVKKIRKNFEIIGYVC
jgi:hypothetical protein